MSSLVPRHCSYKVVGGVGPVLLVELYAVFLGCSGGGVEASLML